VALMTQYLRNRARTIKWSWTPASIVLLTTLLSMVTNLRGQDTPGQAGKDASEASPAVLLGPKFRGVFVLAVVYDKHGKIVPGLTANDFDLEVDGQALPTNAISHFLRQENAPITVGLIAQTSFNQRGVLDQEKNASKTFLSQALRDKDQGFVIHFDREVELLQDLTSAHDKLESALDKLETASMRHFDDSGQEGPDSRDESGQGRSRGIERWGGGTTLYDAIYLASDELMKGLHSRKAVVVVSDGVDRGSKETLESALEAAQRADTVVYTILVKGEETFHDRGGFGRPKIGGGPMGGPAGQGRRRGGGYPQEPKVDGKKILDRLAKETGGRLFEVSKKENLDQIYSAIQEELRSQYELGFTPPNSDSLGFHKLVVKTKQKDEAVQARDGFYLTR
jgi:VWFA-related protein